MQLIKYDAMCSAIAECERVDEVKDIRDKAIAIEAYARQAKNTDAERQACNIRLRAERRVGQMLRDMNANGERHSGRGDQKTESQRDTPKLSDMGISKQQSSRWQKLASVNEKEFESALADSEQKPTTSGLIKKANGSKTKMHPDALWLWGYLRDFERKSGDLKTKLLLGEMTETMLTDIDRICPMLVEFLEEIEYERQR